tara:strand:- start:363 stop:785 length:423 start_codon:yes stop_codon:yes gene_type:complete
MEQLSKNEVLVESCIDMWDKTKFEKASKIVDSVFNNLEDFDEKEWYARRDWTCCNSCGWYKLVEEYKEDNDIKILDYDEDFPDNVVFYHWQEADSFKDCGVLYLTWSGDWKEVKRCFEICGCKVEADGNKNKKIIVDFRK